MMPYYFSFILYYIYVNSVVHSLDICSYTRWFKYDRDWFVCKQAAISPGHIWTTLYFLYPSLLPDISNYLSLVLTRSDYQDSFVLDIPYTT